LIIGNSKSVESLRRIGHLKKQPNTNINERLWLTLPAEQIRSQTVPPAAVGRKKTKHICMRGNEGLWLTLPAEQTRSQTVPPAAVGRPPLLRLGPRAAPPPTEPRVHHPGVGEPDVIYECIEHLGCACRGGGVSATVYCVNVGGVLYNRQRVERRAEAVAMQPRLKFVTPSGPR